MAGSGGVFLPLLGGSSGERSWDSLLGGSGVFLSLSCFSTRDHWSSAVFPQHPVWYLLYGSTLIPEGSPEIRVRLRFLQTAEEHKKRGASRDDESWVVKFRGSWQEGWVGEGAQEEARGVMAPPQRA